MQNSKRFSASEGGQSRQSAGGTPTSPKSRRSMRKASRSKSAQSRRISTTTIRSATSRNSMLSNRTSRSTKTRSKRRVTNKYTNRPGTLDKRARACLRISGRARNQLGVRRRPPISEISFRALSDNFNEVLNTVLQRIALKMATTRRKRITLDNALNFFELSGSHQNIVDKALQNSRMNSRSRSRSASPSGSKSPSSGASRKRSRLSTSSKRTPSLARNMSSISVNSRKVSGIRRPLITYSKEGSQVSMRSRDPSSQRFTSEQEQSVTSMRSGSRVSRGASSNSYR